MGVCESAVQQGGLGSEPHQPHPARRSLRTLRPAKGHTQLAAQNHELASSHLISNSTAPGGSHEETEAQNAQMSCYQEVEL